MAAVVAGDADHGVLAHDATRLGQGGVLLAHMHAVAARGARQIRTVVQDQSHVVRLADRLQPGDGGPDLLVRGLLQADLQGGAVARRQGGLQIGGESVQIRDGGRGDQVQPARRTGGNLRLTSHGRALPVGVGAVNVACACE
ncbi:hypothetical protein D3C73_1312110 [compost metagenome]